MVRKYLDRKDKVDIERMEEKLKETGGDYDTLYRLGWLKAKEKKWKMAVEYFMRAVAIKPTAGLWNNIGNIYFETGSRQKAVEAYSNALVINPKMIDARFNMGYVFFYEGRLSDAARCFSEVLKIDKDNAKAIVMLKKMKE